MSKVDSALVYIWIFAILILCCLNCWTFVWWNEMVMTPILIINVCLSAFIIIGFFVNWVVIQTVKVIARKIDKIRHPERHIPPTGEEIAKTFEELAEILREGDKNEKN